MGDFLHAESLRSLCSADRRDASILPVRSVLSQEFVDVRHSVTHCISWCGETGSGEGSYLQRLEGTQEWKENLRKG